MCLKIKMNFKKSVLLPGGCHQELKGMLCDTLFFLFFFLVLTFYFFPYGTKKGGGVKHLLLFTLLMSLHPSMH